MSDGPILASIFVLSGFSLLLAQIVSVELYRALHALREGVETAFGADQSIFPDHKPS
jgi:hypothetical protein